MEVDLSGLCEEDKIVLDRLGELGRAWIVGGWVRNLVSGMDKEEIDIATDLRPKQVKIAFPRSIMVGEEYGTVIVRIEGEGRNEYQCEVTTIRKEGGYADGRRPGNVTFGSEIGEDLARRDFTINAMAIEPIGELVGEGAPSGKLIDLHGGFNDLESSLLRTVGNAEERIGEDGLRIMRAFRFLDRGEEGLREMDLELSRAISSNLEMLNNVSKERVWNELKRILSCSNSGKIINSMEEHGIFGMILPDTSINTVANHSEDHMVNLALICSENESGDLLFAKKIADDLRLSRKESATFCSLHQCRKLVLDPSVESVRRFVATNSTDQRRKILDYKRGLGEDTNNFESELKQNSQLRAGSGPLIDGILLSKLTGLEGGKRLGRLKDWLHRIQVERDLNSTDDVIALLDEVEWEDSDLEEWQGLSWP